MTKQQAIAAITTKLNALEESRVFEVADFIEAIGTESVLPRPLSDEELRLLDQSRQDFQDGRTLTSAQTRASIDGALAVLGVPKSNS